MAVSGIGSILFWIALQGFGSVDARIISEALRVRRQRIKNGTVFQYDNAMAEYGRRVHHDRAKMQVCPGWRRPSRERTLTIAIPAELLASSPTDRGLETVAVGVQVFLLIVGTHGVSVELDLSANDRIWLAGQHGETSHYAAERVFLPNPSDRFCCYGHCDSLRPTK